MLYALVKTTFLIVSNDSKPFPLSIMKSFFLVVFSVLISLHAQERMSSYDEGQAVPPITVKAYATFLKENPDEGHSYQLYHPPMEKQLAQINASPLVAEESDSHDYIPIDGEENEWMCGLTDLDVRCYEKWRRKNDRQNGTNDGVSSPLMVFGLEEGKKTDPKQNEQNQRHAVNNDPSQALQRGNNDTRALARGGDNQQNRMSTTSAGLGGLQFIDPTAQIVEIQHDLDVLQQGGSLPSANARGERVGLLAGRTVQQVELEQSSSCLPRVRDALSFCFFCLKRTPATGSGEALAMAPIARPNGYGAVATAEPDFSAKLKAILTNQKFKEGRGALTQELQTFLNDESVSNDSSRNQMIADLVSDGTISIKDLSPLVRYLKYQPESFNRTQKQTIIQAVIDQRKQEVAHQLRALPLNKLDEIDRKIFRKTSNGVALLFSPGSRLGLEQPKSDNLDQEPGYLKIQDDAVYKNLVKEAVEEKRNFFINEVANNKSTLIPPQVKPIRFLSFLNVDVKESVVIGAGSFGKVYEAKYRTTQEPLVYKEELRPQGLTKGVLRSDIKSGQDFFRQGDIAAAILKTLPHFVKVEALIIKVINLNKSLALHYVPALHVEEFITSLTNKKIQDIQIFGQLMKRAPGKSLQAILESHEWNSLSLEDRVEHFDAIVQQSFEYFGQAYKENFVHRDIKPMNIVYDITTKTLTIIDAGLATKLDVEPSMIERAGLLFTGHNPMGFRTASQVEAGTPLYKAPAVNKGLPHGPEVDAHAFAKVFLDIIDPFLSQRVLAAACKAKAELSTWEQYEQQCARHRKSFEASPFKTFFNDPKYATRRDLIDAFFGLGGYTNDKIMTAWKSTLLSNLHTAYQKAYPDVATKK